MRDLERELRALPVRWPETPDLAAAVVPRLRPRRRRRWPALLALVLAGGVAAVEPARSAVLDLLGLSGVRVVREQPSAAPAPPGAELDLGRAMSQAQAASEAGFDPRPPAALGAPDGVFFDGRGVSYVYGETPEVLVTEFRPDVTPFLEKTVAPGASVVGLRVGGAPALFISGAHGVALRGPGEEIRFEPQRLAGPTLLVEREDLLIRVEGAATRARAVEIARSVP